MSNTEESTGSQSRSSTGSFNTSRSEKTISKKISTGRLKSELKQIANEPLPGISVGLKDGNIYKWEAAVQGPPDSPYEGGMFLLEISFSESFPFQPPKVTFKTKIDHFSINSNGEIDLDILKKNNYTPLLTVHTVLQLIYRNLSQSSSSDSNGADSPGYFKKVRKTRLEREFAECKKNTSIKVSLKDNNLYEWEATIQGPSGSPYEGGKFILEISFPEYPFKPPVVVFRTRIYHCNVNSDGKLSLDILGKNWSPILDVEKILLRILSLLNDCNTETPSMPEIAAQYINNREGHDKLCREWTKKYAS